MTLFRGPSARHRHRCPDCQSLRSLNGQGTRGQWLAHHRRNVEEEPMGLEAASKHCRCAQMRLAQTIGLLRSIVRAAVEHFQRNCTRVDTEIARERRSSHG